MQDWSSILTSTLSACRASISVILVLAYGFLIRRWKWISQETENGVSKLSVSWFLPFLLFSQISPLATPSNLGSYWIIIVLSLFFQGCSWLIGLAGNKLLGLPQWIIPCMIFNNATSLPLLLLESLGSAGTLDTLIDEGSSLEDVLRKGRVYFLINALVCNLVRFSLGPYLMKDQQQHQDGQQGRSIFSYYESPYDLLSEVKEELTPEWDDVDHEPGEEGGRYPDVMPYPAAASQQQGSEGERAPLLPSSTTPASGKIRVRARKTAFVVARLAKKVNAYVNPPMWGGLAAVVAGLIPFLRHALFDTTGWLSPLAQSIEKLGKLYTVLQMFVLGAHLYSKKGRRPAIAPLLYLFVFRFFLIPALSISTVYGMRQWKWLGNRVKRDPVLDFVMALSPTGPPALTLAAIVEMSDASPRTESSVARTILISYVLAPLISFSVSGALTMVEAVYGK